MLGYSKRIEIINILISTHTINIFLQWISIIAFISYGVACFYSRKLHLEFERYGLGLWRKLIAVLEIFGSLGLLIGFQYVQLRILSSACLSALMFCAILVRIKIKDSLYACLPAIVLFLINLYLVFL